jgi:hypothetical protein
MGQRDRVHRCIPAQWSFWRWTDPWRVARFAGTLAYQPAAISLGKLWTHHPGEKNCWLLSANWSETGYAPCTGAASSFYASPQAMAETMSVFMATGRLQGAAENDEIIQTPGCFLHGSHGHCGTIRTRPFPRFSGSVREQAHQTQNQARKNRIISTYFRDCSTRPSNKTLSPW